MQFGLAHNGNLTNAESLKQELEQRGAIFSSTSDSEILAHLIRRSHNPKMCIRDRDEANVNQLESFRNHQSKTSNLKNSTTQPNIGLFSQNSSTVQEQIALEQDDLEREIGKKNQTSLLEKGTIRAQEDGVLYLNPERNQSSVVTEGTLLAKLYPLLDREGKIKLTDVYKRQASKRGRE